MYQNLIKGKKTTLKQIYFFVNMFSELGLQINFFLFILFCKVLTPMLIKKWGIPKKLFMLEFEGIRIPTLFKIILGIKDSIEIWWSRGLH